MDWFPRAPLTAFQACRRRFVVVVKNKMHFWKVHFSQHLLGMCVCFIYLGKHQIDAERIFVQQMSNFVLRSHLDPIDNQNDPQYL